MPRIRLLPTLVTAAALALGGSTLAEGSALGAPAKITGGTTQLALSSAAQSLLTANHLSVAPLPPATATGGTFTFPIAGGHVNAKTLRGVIRDRGGFSISNGTTTFRVRRPIILSRHHHAWILGFVRSATAHACRQPGSAAGARRCAILVRWTVRRIARINHVSRSNGAATGTAHLTAFSARAINALAGSAIVSRGAVIGTVTVQPKLG